MFPLPLGGVRGGLTTPKYFVFGGSVDVEFSAQFILRVRRDAYGLLLNVDAPSKIKSCRPFARPSPNPSQREGKSSSLFRQPN